MSTKVTKIGITKDKISSRGGITLFLKYVEHAQVYGLIGHCINGLIKKISRGLQLNEFIIQIMAFIIDGTNMSMKRFDELKKDTGYITSLELKESQMASSHAMKRFFKKLSIINDLIFNKILHELFVWRLKISNQEIIILGIDTMVLDNDDAPKREGCEVTYKKKKGFQPLHICWGKYLIDVVFRKGSAHSNHGTDFTDRVAAVVNLIRKRYNSDVAIILCADSGFFDQKAMAYFEKELKIHYIITGKMYQDVKDDLSKSDEQSYKEIRKNKAVWKYIEIGHKLKSWDKYRRCIVTKLFTDEKGQFLLDFSRPDTILYTNIGICPDADQRLTSCGGEQYFNADTIIETAHQRGADELIHRSIKELAVKEQLPFEKFGMNRAYYFFLVFTHFLQEAYKNDVCKDVLPVSSYPNTFRRVMIDFAAKFTIKSRNLILNVSKGIYDQINLSKIWNLCHTPIKIQWE